MIDQTFSHCRPALLPSVVPVGFALAWLFLISSQSHHASAIRVDSNPSVRSPDSHTLFFAGHAVGSRTDNNLERSSMSKSLSPKDSYNEPSPELKTSSRQEAFETQNSNNPPEAECSRKSQCDTWIDKRGSCVSRYVLMFDLWERLVNMRKAFSYMAMMGKDSGFNVVIPFVHGSKVNMKHHLPHHYINRSNPVSTLADYFSYDEMMKIGNVVPYSKWAKISGQFVGGEYWKVASIISAVVYIDWGSAYNKSTTMDFQWCDDGNTSTFHTDYYLLEVKKKHSVHNELAPEVMYERRLCIHGEHIEKMNAISAADYWQRLFEFVESSVKVKQPITIAFQNFRKHAWQRYTESLRNQLEYQDIQSSLVLAGRILERASATAHTKFGGSNFIAVHFRAGNMLNRLNKVNNGTKLAEWGIRCVDRLVTHLVNVKQSDTGALPLFLATDLLNNGMLGGESPRSAIMKNGLSQVQDYLLEQFKSAMTINESDALPLSQYDVMGMASLLDMGMCVHADVFVSMHDRFSVFVDSERQRRGRSSHIVHCTSWETN
mmetsp:Transcript_7731/g.13656  ORF Transcript_7731/g.13656 Transcript_7731/m.13656 type:complete len:546 (-) Transcript_7731:197-1834(-)